MIKVKTLKKANLVGIEVPGNIGGYAGRYVEEILEQRGYRIDQGQGCDMPSLNIEVKTRDLDATSPQTIGTMSVIDIIETDYEDSPICEKIQQQYRIKTRNGVIVENKIYNCKCNCCQHRTFTLNCNGTLGLCPDETYVRPLSDIQEVSENWAAFERKAREQYFTHITQEVNQLCQNCDLFDVCGGNCEPALFDETSVECPLSKSVLNFQIANLGMFKAKLEKAKLNLIELRS
jgi:radical SAM protein with 4Fe4S-binding SPASM domain